jgi:curved DNA-binding protein CbpA
MSYYDILGVSRYASQEAIRLAYRELAKQYHPDALHKAPPKQKAEGEDAIKAINEAFEVLSNPRRRAAYHQVIWTAQDPARKHRFRAPKAADAPGEAPHTASKPNPAEKIFLQLQQLRQELELLGHHHGLKRRRLWFITAFTSIAVFMMISLGVNIYRDPGEFPSPFRSWLTPAGCGPTKTP